MKSLLKLASTIRSGLRGAASHGQAPLASSLGSFLYQLAKSPEVQSVLEIGTWNGQGSTYCLALGLRESGGRLVTLESSKAMFDEAAKFYRSKRLPVEVIYGSSIHPDDFPPFSHFAEIDGGGEYRDRWPVWYQQDLEAARSSANPGALKQVIEKHSAFDLVYLDGGEFTSYQDYQEVAPISTYLVLDDCNPLTVLKNVRARQELLASPQWELLKDEMDDRNGWSAFRKIGGAPFTPR